MQGGREEASRERVPSYMDFLFSRFVSTGGIRPLGAVIKFLKLRWPQQLGVFLWKET